MTTLIITIIVMAICFLAMAVGLIQGKTFTSCGNAGKAFEGEEISCDMCSNKGSCKKKKGKDS